MSDFWNTSEADLLFRAKPKKSGAESKIYSAPNLQYPISLFESHAHINMLTHPSLSIARAGFYGVKFIECMVDVLSEEGVGLYNEADSIFCDAQNKLLNFTGGALDNEYTRDVKVPDYCISVGIHPHYASKYSAEAESLLLDKLSHPKTNALGEIGVDYHYDFSPRSAQRDVFERQLQIAADRGLRVILHIREAFDDAYSILKNFDFLGQQPVLLHCYTSDRAEISRWIEEGCYIAFGGAITFASTDDIRDAFSCVPDNRLLIETDAPFMAPVPFRGVECESAHMLFTYLKMLEVKKVSLDNAASFGEQLFNNACGFFGVNYG